MQVEYLPKEGVGGRIPGVHRDIGNDCDLSAQMAIRTYAGRCITGFRIRIPIETMPFAIAILPQLFKDKISISNVEVLNAWIVSTHGAWLLATFPRQSEPAQLTRSDAHCKALLSTQRDKYYTCVSFAC